MVSPLGRGLLSKRRLTSNNKLHQAHNVDNKSQRTISDKGMDDNSDQDSECDDTSAEHISNVTKKSVSTVGFRHTTENQSARPMSLRPTRSLIGTLDDYRFCNTFQRMELCNRSTSPRMSTVCPCGCYLRPAVTGPFRTREKSSLALHVFAPDILNYHGYNFDANQIALLWKKDCRTFLWKGKSKVKKHH